MAALCSQEFSIYHGVFIASLLLTFGLSLYEWSQRYFENDLPRGQKVFMYCGAVNVTIGILLWTVLYPRDCNGTATSLYPIVAIVDGVFWLLRGLQFRSEAAAQAQGGRTATGSNGTGDAEGER
ncbi:hypothetical protein THAOC_13383 [Thalassiosira oceanica]|uniref:Uncharacterized protein n=1 Tax=Thalassiosira oceanica TaxID=159749 RepID=K0SXL6_THAOC|nr:hypothetical protein THAOC_13383 [Thalassiosira oceanica]|eukprot:EJK65731.1 hypothetical protein THAOC_13383 [Thalassiosira oceanica]